MKKIILLTLASVFATVSVMAQDMTQATETYNAGLEAYQAGDFATALTSLQSALSMAEANGAEGADMAENCKTAIPQIMLSIGKEAARENNYDDAISKLKEASSVAEKYNNADVKAEADGLIPQLRLQKANSLLQAKDFASAAGAYQDVIADDPDNSTAYVRLGSCLSATGDTDGAISAFEKAYELGETATASKQLSNIYLKSAQASLKAQKYQDTIDACDKSNSYLENANAYKIAASAATKLQKSSTAISYYEKYLEVAPDAKDASDVACTVAVLYQQAGNKAKALEYYKKVGSDSKSYETAQAQIKALQ